MCIIRTIQGCGQDFYNESLNMASTPWSTAGNNNMAEKIANPLFIYLLVDLKVT